MLEKLLIEFWTWAGLVLGVAIIFTLDASKKDADSAKLIWSSTAAAAALAAATWPAAWWLGREPSLIYLGTIGLGVVLGAVGALWFLREVPQHVARITQKLTRKSVLLRNSKTDVRDLGKHFPDVAEAFNPSKHFDRERGVFIGLSESEEPIYIPKKLFPKMPHAAVIGTSGSGKGVAAQILAAQWVAAGEAVIVVDPKDDEWAPHQMRQYSQAAGKRYHYLNLRAAEPQFAVFDGATAEQVEEILIAAFGLNDTGTPSDFYNIADRKYAGIVARAIVADRLTPAEAYERFAETLEEQAPKLAGKLRELGEVPAANAKPGHGVSLAKVIAEGGLVYVVGHMRLEKIIRLQKLLAVRVIQIAETRDRLAGDLRPVALILDEAKYHLSRTFLESLGAARDKGVHVTVCFQTLADLTDCGGLNPDAVKGAVVENCRLKIAYQIQDPELAEWLARLTGRILVDVETREVHKNVALTETLEGGRQVRQDERYLVDENMFLSLPPGVGVVFGLGLARFAHISRLPVKKDPAAIQVHAVPGVEMTPPEQLLAMDLSGKKPSRARSNAEQPAEEII